MTFMKPTRKIGPLSVWIVGHTQNPLVSEVATNNALAVFYKKKDAVAHRRSSATLYRVYKATIIRDKPWRRGSASKPKCAVEAELMTAMDERDDALRAIAALQKQVADLSHPNIKTLLEDREAAERQLAVLQKQINGLAAAREG